MNGPYKLIDPAVLMNAAGEDEAGFQELLAMFVRIMPDMSRQLRQAVDDGRLDDIAQHAHSLKSCLSLVGAGACSARLAELERAALRKQADCGAGFAELNDELQWVLAEALGCHAARGRND